MPSSHLPQTLCDNFFNDFLCDFLGIVGGYGLRHVFTLSTGIVRFLLRGQPGVNPYRDCHLMVAVRFYGPLIKIYTPNY